MHARSKQMGNYENRQENENKHVPTKSYGQY